jgi:hypothetical protein
MSLLDKAKEFVDKGVDEAQRRTGDGDTRA